ncbi:hypothetical protein TNIN_285351 [Trichonephila inaurata madagascariensis]|uniref:Uncharacterized protein n=1 Tax=Trichonephila inaurata madagascariensis TaxID=2747483 RepID=A0A8X6XYI1_9ARAC|nr:hypothetical protein TNIN_285351 [Trichonephila inaurata madagascariensis]
MRPFPRPKLYPSPRAPPYAGAASPRTAPCPSPRAPPKQQRGRRGLSAPRTPPIQLGQPGDWGQRGRWGYVSAGADSSADQSTVSQEGAGVDCCKGSEEDGDLKE